MADEVESVWHGDDNEEFRRELNRDVADAAVICHDWSIDPSGATGAKVLGILRGRRGALQEIRLRRGEL